MSTKAAVVGTTTWGTTLALQLCRNGVRTALLARTEDEAHQLRKEGENRRFLPGTPLPSALEITASTSEALADAEVVMLAVPSQRFRRNLLWIRDSVGAKAIAVSAAKGLEMQTGKPMSVVFAEEMPISLARRYCVLSGPNLAKEIIAGKPASTVVASGDLESAKSVQRLLMSTSFRVYTNDDVIGVELAGALKNIIALGSGICDGLGYGDNAKAAFISRGLAEITRLGVDAGANPLTFAGLAGLGDLAATCFSRLSRNRSVGEELARGRTLTEILESMENVAEGVHTTAAALTLAQRLDVEMPIVEATHEILFEGCRRGTPYTPESDTHSAFPSRSAIRMRKYIAAHGISPRGRPERRRRCSLSHFKKLGITHQVAASGLGDDNDIFKTDPAHPRVIQTRFHRDHMILLQSIPGSEAESGRFMNVQTQSVAGSMEEALHTAIRKARLKTGSPEMFENLVVDVIGVCLVTDQSHPDFLGLFD